MSGLTVSEAFSSIDLQFAGLMCRKGASSELFSVFARLSQTMLKQNTCLLITEQATLEALRDANCVTVVQAADPNTSAAITTPLVLLAVDDTRAFLFTQRFYAYESRIATELIARNQAAQDGLQSATAVADFITDQDDPLQIIAAVQACLRQLTIITGGPGTGKTSTVVKILAGLLKANPDLRLRMAAPTGKAAMRLSESVKSAAARLNITVPTEVSTLHRLLRVRGDGRSYHYHPGNQLPLDVLILDEASMIDVVMFDRLLGALPRSTRLIVLGDPFQLPSVESGNVLAAVTAQGTVYSEDVLNQIEELSGRPLPFDANRHISHHVLANSHCALQTSYRFSDDAGIGRLAKALRGQDTVQIDEDASQSEVVMITEFEQADAIRAMTALYDRYLEAAHGKADAEQLLELFDRVRLLTPVKEGDFGVNQLNEAFEAASFPDTGSYYHGKPIMVERNHYALRLFNGDVGICVEHEGRLEVAFRTSDNEIEYFLPSRLPQHDTCFAMTVHKSQGSEYDQVCLVLPETSQEDFISREMIYTGVTRCRKQLTLLTKINLSETKNHERISGLHLRFRQSLA